ncbi:MAG: hypothetical protein ACRDC4_03485 [Plesiomonas sp.]
MDEIVVVDTNEMILDMDTFDFSMIDDADIQEATQPEVAEDEEVEVETEEESEEEETEEETEEQSEEDGSEEEVEDSDEEEVDFDEYEIDLPSGEKVVLSDLVKGYKTASEVEAEVAKLESIKQEMEQKSAGMDRFLRLAKLEAERVIEDYVDFDWVTLAKEDPQAYVENREFLDKYKARHKEIIEAVSALEERDEAEKKRVTEDKARTANAELARDIPGWGNDMYANLINYALSKGANEEEMRKCMDPFVFKLLHKNMEYERGVQKVKAKVKKVGGAPKKVVKTAPAKPSQTNTKPNKEALIKKAAASGDMSAWFRLLED